MQVPEIAFGASRAYRSRGVDGNSRLVCPQDEPEGLLTPSKGAARRLGSELQSMRLSGGGPCGGSATRGEEMHASVVQRLCGADEEGRAAASRRAAVC